MLLRERPPRGQLLVGAQVYENQKATYKEINQCLSMWKLRHLHTGCLWTPWRPLKQRTNLNPKNTIT